MYLKRYIWASQFVVAAGGGNLTFGVDRREGSKRQKTDLVQPFFCLRSAVDCYEILDGRL
jgi:hypothetical protein